MTYKDEEFPKQRCSYFSNDLIMKTFCSSKEREYYESMYKCNYKGEDCRRQRDLNLWGKVCIIKEEIMR